MIQNLAYAISLDTQCILHKKPLNFRNDVKSPKVNREAYNGSPVKYVFNGKHGIDWLGQNI